MVMMVDAGVLVAVATLSFLVVVMLVVVVVGEPGGDVNPAAKRRVEQGRGRAWR